MFDFVLRYKYMKKSLPIYLSLLIATIFVLFYGFSQYIAIQEHNLNVMKLIATCSETYGTEEAREGCYNKAKEIWIFNFYPY